MTSRDPKRPKSWPQIFEDLCELADVQLFTALKYHLIHSIVVSYQPSERSTPYLNPFQST